MEAGSLFLKCIVLHSKGRLQRTAEVVVSMLESTKKTANREYVATYKDPSYSIWEIVSVYCVAIYKVETHYLEKGSITTSFFSPLKITEQHQKFFADFDTRANSFSITSFLFRILNLKYEPLKVSILSCSFMLCLTRLFCKPVHTVSLLCPITSVQSVISS